MMLINMYEGALITCGCYDAMGTARSLGLTNMRERAELPGGQFTIGRLRVMVQPSAPAGRLTAEQKILVT